MGAPLKTGLDYFSHDVTMGDDRKVKLLMLKFGFAGKGLYDRILEAAYKEKGYYYKPDEEDILLLSGEGKMSPEEILTIIDYMVSKDLFNKKYFDSYKILTSKRMQKQYIRGCEARTSVKLIEEYLLINPEEQKSKRAKFSIEIVKLSGEKIVKNNKNVLKEIKNVLNYEKDELNKIKNAFNLQKEKEKEKERKGKRKETDITNLAADKSNSDSQPSAVDIDSISVLERYRLRFKTNPINKNYLIYDIDFYTESVFRKNPRCLQSYETFEKIVIAFIRSDIDSEKFHPRMLPVPEKKKESVDEFTCRLVEKYYNEIKKIFSENPEITNEDAARILIKNIMDSQNGMSKEIQYAINRHTEFTLHCSLERAISFI